MADRLMRAQVTIPWDSGVPEDSCVNTWYFDQDDNGLLPPPDLSYDAVMADLAAFYQAIDGELFPASVGGEATVRIYDMRDPEPRIVRRQETFVLTPSAVAAFPGEVAICLSFAADPLPGVNPARRRGRVFLGPIHQNVGSVETGGVRIAATKTAAIADAAVSLLTPTDVGGSSLTWAMYSRATDLGGASIDDSFHDVQRVWVDNAFDTQRRRGLKANAREERT